MIKILVTGAEGQLGKSLSQLCDKIDGLFLFTNRRDLDLLDPASIKSILKSFPADYIINCAAYTAVDNAEKEEVKAFAVNETGVVNLINESEAYGSKIIHASTDYVFNGEASTPYNEETEINPQSVYGHSKAAGENALLSKAGHRSIIIRTSWLYSEFGHNFLKTMLRLGKEKEEINVVSDQIGIPTYSKDLAQAIIDIILLNPSIPSNGMMLHFSNSQSSNWYEFAAEIMKMSGLKCKVNPIPSSAFPTLAKRPAYSVLDTQKIENLLHFKIRSWKDALNECIEILKKQDK